MKGTKIRLYGPSVGLIFKKMYFQFEMQYYYNKRYCDILYENKVKTRMDINHLKNLVQN